MDWYQATSSQYMWVGCVEKVGLSTEKARNGENDDYVIMTNRHYVKCEESD